MSIIITLMTLHTPKKARKRNFYSSYFTQSTSTRCYRLQKTTLLVMVDSYCQKNFSLFITFNLIFLYLLIMPLTIRRKEKNRIEKNFSSQKWFGNNKNPVATLNAFLLPLTPCNNRKNYCSVSF